MIKFIEERLYLSMHKTDLEMEMLIDLLQKSLDQEQRSMSKDVEAVGLRFRFLHLALYLVQSDFLTSSINRTLLREKIYQTAFNYFT